MSSGKAKGSGFEREQCRLFSLWWTDGKRDDVFWRTDSSGGRATQRKNLGKDTAFQQGDITFSDPIGVPLVEKLSIECKTYKVVDFLGMFCKKSSDFSRFWKQCKKDAELSHRIPVLVLHINRGKTMMFTTKSWFLLLRNLGFTPSRKLVICLEDETIVGFLQDEFFLQADSEWWKAGLFS